MRNFEFSNTNVGENLTCIRASLIKAVNDGENVVSVFSSLFFDKENFDAMKQELKMRLGDLCIVKPSRSKVFCGYMTSGLEVHFLSKDKDLLKSRIFDLFKGKFTSEIKTFDKQRS